MREYIVGFTDDADMERFERIHGTNGKLIRCKDCKHYIGKWCTKYPTKQFDINDIWDDNDFCSRAERKED